MSEAAVSVGPRGLLWPAVLTLTALVVLVGLGTWQIERKAWKEGLIAALDERLAAPAAPLPPSDQWADLDRAGDEFRRVKFRAEFIPEGDAIVWATGSAIRDDVKPPGFFVFTPARLQSGELVVVNRGFVKNDRPSGSSPRPPPERGIVEIVGLLRWPEQPGWLTPSRYGAKDRLWFVREPAAMAAVQGWGTVAPFYIERESQQPPDALPPPGPMHVNLPNNHLQYALTWYGLAVVLVVIFGFWMRDRSA